MIEKVVFRGVDVTNENYTVSGVTINSVTTTNADGEVTYGSGQKYISWAKGDTLTLRTSVRDYTADLTITLNYEGQTYTFNHTIAVKSNISQVNDNNKVVGLTEATAQTISVGDVVAGTAKEIVQNDLFSLTNGDNAEFTYSWTSNNTGVIASQESAIEGPVTFTPNNVANAGQDVTLMVEVTMTDGALTSTFFVRLQVHVVCAGKVTVNYPVIGETHLQAEYLETTTESDSAAEFGSARSFFFGSKAVFATNYRVQLADISMSEGGDQTSTTITDTTGINDSDLSITIIGAQNIDVMQIDTNQDVTHKNASTDSNEIDLDSKLKFVLGHGNAETGKNTHTGEE